MAGTVAAFAAPTIVRAEDKAGAKAPILGTGEHTSEWVDDWGALPEGWATPTLPNGCHMDASVSFGE